MVLYLVQHGQSQPKEIDPEKGLSDEGRAEVELIAKVAQGYAIPVKAIKHSGKKRARQTADIFASFLQPNTKTEAIKGVNPLDDVALFAETAEDMDGQMLVGHLPFMARLTSYLITGTIDTPIFRFQNGGIVCLVKDQDAQFWIIKWSLMPKIG